MIHITIRKEVIDEMHQDDQKLGIANRFYEWQEIHNRVMWKKEETGYSSENEEIQEHERVMARKQGQKGGQNGGVKKK